jgi:hypothetical protein
LQGKALKMLDKPTDTLISERSTTHGSFEENAALAQRIKAAMLDADGWRELAPDQREALQMIASKIGRILSGKPDFKDHWDDIAGYAQLVGATASGRPGDAAAHGIGRKVRASVAPHVGAKGKAMEVHDARLSRAQQEAVNAAIRQLSPEMEQATIEAPDGKRQA